MTCDSLLILPINDFSVSVLIVFGYNAYFMSLAKPVCFSFGRNNLRG